MKFEVDHRFPPAVTLYPHENLQTAREFAKKINAEFGALVKACILFGESARSLGEGRDIDILIVIDDVSIVFSPELVQTYRILLEKIVASTSKKLHVMSLKLTTFWEYARAGEPVMMNIVRDGVALIDYGFFDPLQLLLRQGRIRPSPEAIWNYLVRAPATLSNSEWHLLQAILDLYWAVIDSAHAAVMSVGSVPPSPQQMSELIREKLVKPGIVASKYAEWMDTFFKLSKKIVHRELVSISGGEYDKYRVMAKEFVSVMRAVVQKHLKGNDARILNNDINE